MLARSAKYEPTKHTCQALIIGVKLYQLSNLEIFKDTQGEDVKDRIFEIQGILHLHATIIVDYSKSVVNIHIEVLAGFAQL
jgi:hypothetical protein